MSKFFLALVVVVLAVGAYLWYDGSLANLLGEVTPPPQQTEIPTPSATTTDQSASSTTAAPSVLPTPMTDTSDNALNTDVKAIDDQMSQMPSDSAGIDAAIASSSLSK